ncbi:alcohol dehydrogenase [Guyanagaster necrorhizus]|uniref:Alcohol dehydrogenase n=1 Tax=Guyanagaster necrorhizus TaxID=856835 RepID=A0A9P7W1Z3_9AGAR|nr:alcohol dehydrogenase [Guyanagaster necrorhizus MCA 3950]KAG7451157.1 alcohol dehydrogenase [Guyanagaster necrorhizus MCA 3950]
MSFKRIVLNERPKGHIEKNTFRSEQCHLKDYEPKQGRVLVQVTWLSLDPAMRGYLNNVRSYMPPVQIGETMRAVGLGVVIKKAEGSQFSVGDIVCGEFGWTEYAIMEDNKLKKITVPPGAEPLDFLNSLGLPAYIGLKEVCDIKKGETLVVSGAAGAVGSLVCQLAKREGAKVIAIAGTDEKCDWLKNEVGVDVTLNYKSPTFAQDFKKLGYVDAFFDNVGGEMLDLVLTRLNKGARIALCGAISAYNERPKGLKNYLTLISQRAKMQGFIVFDYDSMFAEAIAEISKGLGDGSLKRKFHIVEGLESAPAALPMLFSGQNNGKLVVKVSSGPQSKL